MKYLITGATSGIGLATAMELSKEGHELYLIGRNFEALEKLKQDGLFQSSKFIKADLTVESDLDLVQESISQIDGLVFAAGITKVLPFKFTKASDIQELHSINYLSQVLLLQKLLLKKKLNKKASIVLISSTSAICGMRGNSLYAATKGALISFAKSLSLELAPQQIRINCILPAVVKTPMVEKSIDPQHLIEHAKLYPLGLGEPQDIAYGASFLLSEKARWITGTTLVMDGGFSAQ